MTAPDPAEYLNHCTPCWYGQHEHCAERIVSGGTRMVECLCKARGHVTTSARPEAPAHTWWG